MVEAFCRTVGVHCNATQNKSLRASPFRISEIDFELSGNVDDLTGKFAVGATFILT